MAAAREQQLRNIALRHAFDIEDKKRLQNQITDLVIECFDLPTNNATEEDTDTSKPPVQSDFRVFKNALILFQSSDFDDLVYERNVDSRCGYALCGKPNRKFGTSVKVWNGKSGKDFQIVPREELEKWCSEECARKAAFVRGQLSTEPAWVRSEPYPVVKLPEDPQQPVKDNEPVDVSEDANITERMRLLALERGDLGVDESKTRVTVSDKLNASDLTGPPTFSM